MIDESEAERNFHDLQITEWGQQMSDESNIDDFIQQAVNKGYEESIKRAQKRILYKRERYNEKRNKIRVKRKIQRQARKKARGHF